MSLKRSLDDEENSPRDQGKPVASPTASSTSNSSASSFRNVSACNRCRLRKNRCDQRLPACAPCEKASVKCVGYDPITKREIPRSYVYYLETRVSYLESLLQDNSIPFSTAEDFNPSYQSVNVPPNKQTSGRGGDAADGNGTANNAETSKEQNERYDREKLTKLVSNIGMVSVQGASDPRFLGSTSGISFARVVFAAVKSSVSGASSERGSARGTKALPGTVADGGTSMRDSFFGLHTKPHIRQAPFPDRELGLKLVELYFHHANPQIPILHKGEFMSMFDRVYASSGHQRTSRESYMLNIVYAIGAGIIMGSSELEGSPTSDSHSPTKAHFSPPSHKKRRLAGQQHQPEEYHASAIVHLENFLGSTPAADRPDGFGAGLEELQAVLLLAGFALLRPVAPGLWYIVGVAVRLAVDLGLHYEDGVGIDASDDQVFGNPDQKTNTENSSGTGAKIDAKERGRRQWVRDLRRRLWWCTYSFDRLVSTCVGRPFGITDQVVTTEFPSMMDDCFITKEGFDGPPESSLRPSYKLVAHHYFRLRLLQSEILQVLQHRQAQQARASGANQGNDFMHTKLPSPFLANFASFRSWRQDIDRRLLAWKEEAPNKVDTGVQFSPLFLELNYWQAVIMLYRQSLVVPQSLASELGPTSDDVSSPTINNLEDRDDEELVFLKVAEAGQKVLKLYRQLHRVHLVNYTFLATHHLFMAGISFLYAIWHSPVVRSHLTIDDVDFTVLAATSVLGDLIEKCPPAEACRDAFSRMATATISMCMSTTGFGPQALRLSKSPRPSSQSSSYQPSQYPPDQDVQPEAEVMGYGPNYYRQQPNRRPAPRFDMNLRDLFSDDETDRRSFSRISNRISRSTGMPPPPIPPQASASVKQEQMQGLSSNPNISPNLNQRPPQQSHQRPTYYLDQTLRQMHEMPPPSTSLPPHTHTPSISPYQISNQMPYSNFAANIQSTYPDLGTFNELDFLDTFPVQGGSSQSGGTGEAAGGLGDLGFGMGFDGGHDFSDGNGFDLFDGFFFGPGGTGGNGGGSL